MDKRERARIALVIIGGMVLGGAAGTGVKAGMYPPLVAVGIAVVIGLTIGVWLLRKVLAYKRAAISRRNM